MVCTHVYPPHAVSFVWNAQAPFRATLTHPPTHTPAHTLPHTLTHSLSILCTALIASAAQPEVGIPHGTEFAILVFKGKTREQSEHTSKKKKHTHFLFVIDVNAILELIRLGPCTNTSRLVLHNSEDKEVGLDHKVCDGGVFVWGGLCVWGGGCVCGGVVNTHH
jgi:hypothetical protein